MEVIYRIDTLNGGVYIGSAEDYAVRKTTHLSALRNKRHSNWHLQRDFKRYGEEGFSFSVIETVDNPYIVEENGKTRLINREQYWIDETRKLIMSDKFYNINPIAGRTAKGRKMRDETKRMLSAKATGRKQRKDVVERIAAKKRGVSTKGKTYRLLSPDGKLFETNSLGDFARQYDLDASNLYKLFNGKRIQYKGWKAAEGGKTPKTFDSINAKTYIFISPSGEVTEIINLRKFCTENNLNQGNMQSVAAGKRNQHKGWKRYTAE